jgi:competence protein ComEC
VAAYLWLPALDSNQLELHVLDVGQGLAVLLQVDGKTLLYDTGPGWPGDDAGRQLILPVLHRMGIAKLDTLVISHWDSDHSGGARSITMALPVARLLAPTHKLPHFPKADKCRRGIQWSWGQAHFEFLHPANPEGWSDNNASCVLLIRFGQYRILLPGDIEAPIEPLVVRQLPAGAIDIVVAPHHGSRSSSSSQFVAHTQPAFVIFSTAYANRWGFPDERVRRRWEAVSGCAIATADTGAISIVLDAGKGLSTVNFAKDSLLRPWVLRLPPKVLCTKHSRAL